jgi:hypothetical protein
MRSGRGVDLRIFGLAAALTCASFVVLLLARSSAARPRTTPRVVRQSGCVTGSSIGLRAPCVRTARQMRRRPGSGDRDLPGAGVSSSQLFSDRVFLNAREGVALVNAGGAQYPALSVDGGRVWRIAGPQLHVDAADGPEAVAFVGIDSPRTFFAYGSSAVDVTTDRGRSWWETFLGEQVQAVIPGGAPHELVAYVSQSESTQHSNPAATWQYISLDGGRHWHFSTNFAGFPG